MYNEINIYNLKKLLKEDINLIDIRDKYSYNNGTIKDAKNIDKYSLMSNPNNYLDKSEYYYIFCDYGTTSSYICQMLSMKGYKVINIIGGYNSYVKDSI